MPKIDIATLNIFVDNFEPIEDQNLTINSEERKINFLMDINSLGEDVKIILETFIGSDIINNVSALTRYLRGQGWKNKNIKRAINKIKTFLQEN